MIDKSDQKGAGVPDVSEDEGVFGDQVTLVEILFACFVRYSWLVRYVISL